MQEPSQINPYFLNAEIAYRRSMMTQGHKSDRSLRRRWVEARRRRHAA